MLTQKLSLGYSSRIISQGIGMAVGILVARLAGPTVLGTVAYAMSFVSLFVFVSDFGLGNAHVKLVSEGRPLGPCIGTFSKLKSYLIVLYAIVVMCIVGVQGVFFHRSFESADHVIVLLIWLGSTVMSQLSLIPATSFMALTEQAKQDVPAFLQQLFTQGLRVLVVVIGLGAIGLSLAQLIGILLLTAAYFHLFRSYPKGAFDSQLAREYFRLGMPFVIIGLCSSMLEYLDRVLLQYFSNSEQVGYYAAGYGFAGFIRGIGLMVGILFFPIFSSAVSRNDFAFINRTIDRFQRITYLFILPFVILLMVYSDLLIQILLGVKYEPSGAVLKVLLLGMFIYSANVPFGNLIVGMGRLKLCAIALLLNLVFFVGLDVLILANVPLQVRALGSSVAICVSAAALGLTYRFIVSRLTKEVETWKYLWHMIFGIILWAITDGLASVLALGNSIFVALVFPIVFLLVAIGFPLLCGWIKHEDFLTVLRIIDLRRLSVYIRDEFSSRNTEN